MINKLKELGLVRKNIEDREIVTIELVGDYNDADYDTTKNKFYLDEEYYVNKLKKVINILKDNIDIIMSRGFFRAEYEDIETSKTEEELEELYDTITNLLSIPFGEDMYCHTLKSIKIYYTDKTGTTIELELEENK